MTKHTKSAPSNERIQIGKHRANEKVNSITKTKEVTCYYHCKEKGDILKMVLCRDPMEHYHVTLFIPLVYF